MFANGKDTAFKYLTKSLSAQFSTFGDNDAYRYVKLYLVTPSIKEIVVQTDNNKRAYI